MRVQQPQPAQPVDFVEAAQQFIQRRTRF
jgi:hypothetical protein